MKKDKKSIKRDILDRFRSMEDDEAEDFVIPINSLFKEYKGKFHSYDRQTVLTAAKELVSTGVVEILRGATPKLKLTNKGANLIFQF